VAKPLASFQRFLGVALLFTCLGDYAAAQGNTADLQGTIIDPA